MTIEKKPKDMGHDAAHYHKDTIKEVEKKPNINAKNIVFAADTLTKACHGRAWNNGWWHDPKTGQKLIRPVPEMLCLIHSEISEGLEGYRKDKMDDHLTERKMLEVELADALIRIFDMAGGLGLDVAGAMAEKMDYNDSRADHKIENRVKAGGKKI